MLASCFGRTRIDPKHLHRASGAQGVPHCKGKCSGGGDGQSIESTVFDAVLSIWLWSTATRRFRFGYFSIIDDYIINPTNSGIVDFPLRAPEMLFSFVADKDPVDSQTKHLCVSSDSHLLRKLIKLFLYCISMFRWVWPVDCTVGGQACPS